jgi:hypothetical protein
MKKDREKRIRIEVQGNGIDSYKVRGICRRSGEILCQEETVDRSSESLTKTVREVTCSSDNLIWVREMLIRVV